MTINYIIQANKKRNETQRQIGRKFSEETKRKIREARQRQVFSDETRQKLSENSARKKSFAIKNKQTGEEIEFDSIVNGYRYLRSIGVKATRYQFNKYLVYMAQGKEPVETRSKDLRKYTAKFI
ncbi:NUMOD3 domain-containing DNA-binding protein [Kurthia massiliensis]|uniref:NUMOD3 domain-containing DNA-binding protein n=1 Tax=Kurthia massiliensis TaxID=1033739 RepID=UPI000287F2D8|nr:NUMOD3 domain-containing DNA-binding protein [Kurthia massiliensis]